MNAVGSKRGELLPYRPRTDALVEPVLRSSRTEPLVGIRCCGHEFEVRESMAGIFLRRVQEIISVGGAELVPLLHTGGVELLFITPATPFTVVNEVTPNV